MVPVFSVFHKIFSHYPWAFRQRVWAEQLILALTFGGAAAVFWLSGADNALARALYNPLNMGWPWTLRQYGTWPGTALALIGLLIMLWPVAAKRWPLLYRTAIIITLSTILGAGLFNQVLVKDLADRARPRETILLATSPSVPDGFEGHSMPSGHAGMGFVLTAPFFPLRRRYPRLARIWLIGGMTAGFTIGCARMILGAHYLSDVLIAGWIALATASALHAVVNVWLEKPVHIIPRLVRPFPFITAFLGVSTAAAFIGLNPVTLRLDMPLSSTFSRFHLPCDINVVPIPALTKRHVYVNLRGYGAPVSTLTLVERGGVVSIDRSRGVYHSLVCTAEMHVPAAE